MMGRLERRLRDVRSVIKYLKDDDDETARQNNGKNSGLLTQMVVDLGFLSSLRF